MKSPNHDIRPSHAWAHTSTHVHLLAQGNTHRTIRNTSHLSPDLFIMEWGVWLRCFGLEDRKSYCSRSVFYLSLWSCSNHDS